MDDICNKLYLAEERVLAGIDALCDTNSVETTTANVAVRYFSGVHSRVQQTETEVYFKDEATGDTSSSFTSGKYIVSVSCTSQVGNLMNTCTLTIALFDGDTLVRPLISQVETGVRPIYFSSSATFAFEVPKGKTYNLRFMIKLTGDPDPGGIVSNLDGNRSKMYAIRVADV